MDLSKKSGKRLPKINGSTYILKPTRKRGAPKNCEDCESEQCLRELLNMKDDTVIELT